jgi:hypothetical protein
MTTSAKFEVKVYRDVDAAIGADIALKARLYVSGWSLSETFKSIREGSDFSDIAVGFLDNEPVCVTVVGSDDSAAFCRKALRRKGYATRCLQRLNTKGTVAGPGVAGSDRFWKKNGVKLWGDQ